MGFQIDHPDADRLVAEVAKMAKESETEAVIRALEERRDRLAATVAETKDERVSRVLREEIWPLVPDKSLGKAVTKEEREEILGYGPDGV